MDKQQEMFCSVFLFQIMISRQDEKLREKYKKKKQTTIYFKADLEGIFGNKKQPIPNYFRCSHNA